MKNTRSQLIAQIVLGCLSILLPSSLPAQIITDGTMGIAETLNGPNYSITPDLGIIQGNGLFHSFSEFNVNAGETATFSGPDSIANVFSRVTGGNSSNIDGLLRSTIKDANFYFLNPSGVMFGSNARLDVDGSFVVSSADYVTLSENGRFDATQPGNTILTSASVEAFGFLSNAPAGLSLNGGTLKVADNQTLSIIGGDIHIDGGKIESSSGELTIVSVKAEGEVEFDGLTKDPEHKLDAFDSLGEVHILNNSLIDISGEGGGGIHISGNNLLIADSIISSNTNGAVDGRNLEFNLSGKFNLFDSGTISTITSGSGNGGNIHVKADTVEMDNLGVIEARTGFDTQGKSGSVFVEANAILTNTGGRIVTEARGDQPGGDVEVHANSLTFIGGDFATGISSGLFSLSCFNDVQDPSDCVSTGNSGAIRIFAETLDLLEGGTISATSSNNAGSSGNIEITADKVNMSGFFVPDPVLNLGFDASGVYSNMRNNIPVTGGNITLKANELNMSNLARINAFTPGPGSGGNIFLEVDTLKVIEGAILNSTTFGTGNGGNINIRANDVILSGPSPVSFVPVPLPPPFSGEINIPRAFTGIFALTGLQGGSAGNVKIQSETLSILDGAEINTLTVGAGAGGMIELKVNKRIRIAGNDSENDIPSRTLASTLLPSDILPVFSPFNAFSTGAAGEIIVETANLQLKDHGTIDVQSTSAGDGGDLSIVAKQITLMDHALITATSTGSGTAGDITIADAKIVSITDSNMTTASESTDGGSVTLNNIGSMISLNSQIEAQAGNNGGNIRILAHDRIHLSNSHISSNAGNDGGNIFIDPQFVTLDDSDLTANATLGNGGDITIISEVFIASSASQITASSDFGISGNIEVFSPDIDIAGSLTVLSGFLDVSKIQLQPSCASRLSDEVSTFTVKSNEGILTPPDDFLPSF